MARGAFYAGPSYWRDLAGLLVQRNPVVRRPPPRRGLRPDALRGPQDPHPFSPALLETSPGGKRRKLAADLIAKIEAEAAARRQRTGSQVLGASAVRGQHPFSRPKKSKKSPAPLFHAASQAVRRELYEMYGWFAAAFREASEKLRAGNRMVSFPAGSFPPALPFVAGLAKS